MCGPPAKVAVTHHSPAPCLGLADSRAPKEAYLRRAAGGTEPLDQPGSFTARQGSQALPGAEDGPSVSTHSSGSALAASCHWLQELGGAAREFRLGLDGAQSFDVRLRAAVWLRHAVWGGKGQAIWAGPGLLSNVNQALCDPQGMSLSRCFNLSVSVSSSARWGHCEHKGDEEKQFQEAQHRGGKWQSFTRTLKIKVAFLWHLSECQPDPKSFVFVSWGRRKEGP